MTADDSGSSADTGAAALKDPNYSVGADSSLPPGVGYSSSIMPSSPCAILGM